MAITIHTDPIPLAVDRYGVVRVGGTRVTLDVVINAYQQGAAPEEIQERFTTLTLPDIYAAIAYYLRHRSEPDPYLAERQRLASSIRKELDAQPDSQAVRERLMKRSSTGPHAKTESC